MEVLLVGGPLDGQRVEAAEGATLVTSQKGDSYIRALHGVYVTAEVGTPEGYMGLLSQKLIDGYNLRHRVGMAITQLDDAMMYLEPTGETAAESSVKKAREILSHD